jgi:hypothetical protein
MVAQASGAPLTVGQPATTFTAPGGELPREREVSSCKARNASLSKGCSIG